MEELSRVLSYRAEQLRSQQTQTSLCWHSSGRSKDDDKKSHATQPGKRKRVDIGENGDINAGPILQHGGVADGGTLALCLSSHRRMCINARPPRESDRETLHATCASMTSCWTPKKSEQSHSPVLPPSSRSGAACQYFDGSWLYVGEASTASPRVFDLEELKKWGEAKNWCPHNLTRQAIQHSSVIVLSYQYMLYPKVAKMLSQELEAESIIVFEEAHNIDRVCLEAFSLTIQSRHLEQATRSLGRLSNEINRLRAKNGTRLREEYQHLLTGLIDQELLNTNPEEVGLASNIRSPDVVHEAVPGNIRRAEHFIVFMKKIVEYLKARLRTVVKGGVTNESPLSFLHRIITSTSLEVKTLKFAYSRLSSLLRTLQVPNLDDFKALADVADFASLVSTYSEGLSRFAIIMEPRIAGSQHPGIHLACLDSALAIAPIFERFRSVIITSGNLSPLDVYPKLLQFEPFISESFNMSTIRPCIYPMIVTRGSDQLPMSTKFHDRCDMGVVRNYGE